MGIFRAMDGYPVTIRLIDPPLHEFVPHDAEKQKELAQKIGLAPEVVARRVEQLSESNPMLGHRGCRLLITYPEILDMQVGAIIEAALECRKEGIKVIPEIMHALTMDRKELQILVDETRRIADNLIQKAGIKLEYLVGTMIELPRAALLAEFTELGVPGSVGIRQVVDPHFLTLAQPPGTPAGLVEHEEVERHLDP